MIGRLCGKLLEKHPPHLLLDVGGVGYCLQAPVSTFLELPEVGQEVVLRVHHIVREDAALLFGFISAEECRLFGALIKINGVGPKIALAILSGLSPQEFMQVISVQNSKRLQSIPGIGAKMAQRILVEMQTNPKQFDAFSATVFASPVQSVLHEAVAALVTLGYKHAEALKAINKIQNPSQSCEKIIKEALQGLAKV